MARGDEAGRFTKFRSDLKNRWRVLWFVFLAFIPVGFAGEVMFKNSYVAYAWMTLIPIALFRFSTLRCPACDGKPFFLSSLKNALENRCSKCGVVIR